MKPGDPTQCSFGELLYRYFWPFQYFRDVTRGSQLEQVQNYRFNRTMRRYLPGFAVKWCCLSALSFGAGALCETALSVVVPARYAASYPLASPSGQRVAFGFLHISSHPEHPCRSANSSPCRASRGLPPPSGCALPGAPRKKGTQGALFPVQSRCQTT